MQDKPHRFYEWSKRKQNGFLCLCGMLFFVVIVLSFAGLLLGWYWSVLLYPLIFILAQFADTPLGHRSGRLIYFSPLFLAEKEKSGGFILHGGTVFDYVFVFSWQQAGETARRQVVEQFIAGLLAFVRYLEANDLYETRIKGSSYFFNARNAHRYGFEIVKTEDMQRLIMAMNYAVLLVMYSFTQGKVALPPIREIKTVQSTGKKLIGKRKQIMRVLRKIESRGNQTSP
jgi:hypothetical protein